MGQYLRRRTDGWKRTTVFQYRDLAVQVMIERWDVDWAVWRTTQERIFDTPRKVYRENPEHVSRETAEDVLEWVKGHWPGSEGWSQIDGPVLYAHDHEELPDGCWSIAWEGGPEDWVYKVQHGRKDVFVEAIASWCLGIYPGW